MTPSSGNFRNPSVTFITNFCPHYRVRTFEMLARELDLDFVFFSPGDEWFWEKRHGVRFGDFPYRTVGGFWLPFGIRVTPGLLPMLWRSKSDVFIKDIDGPVPLLMTLLVAKLRRKPFVLWTGMWSEPRTLFHRLYQPIVRRVYRAADAIVVYGEHTKRFLAGLGVNPGKVFVAPHAIDNEEYARPVAEAEKKEARERFGLGDRRVLLFVGRLEPVKGLDVLLDAFAKADVPGSVLVLVGEGTLKDDLKDRVARLGLTDRVVFAGFVPADQTTVLYSLAEALVLPSVTVPQGKELWGLVVNEAMNQGTPVIASSAVGAVAGGLVRQGVNGEVFGERDVEALSAAIRRMLTDSAHRSKLGSGAALAIQAWDNEKMVEGFVQSVTTAASCLSTRYIGTP